MIPGFEKAEFAAYGLHHNTFINSPLLLDKQLRLKSKPHIRFTGQITGVEGYVESAAMGLLAGLAVFEAQWQAHASGPRARQPWALCWPIFAAKRMPKPSSHNLQLWPLPANNPGRGGRERKLLYTNRAQKDFKELRFLFG